MLQLRGVTLGDWDHRHLAVFYVAVKSQRTVSNADEKVLSYITSESRRPVEALVILCLTQGVR
jgi:hypothetical protein